MKNFSKAVVLLVLAVFMMATLVGCGSTPSSTASSSPSVDSATPAASDSATPSPSSSTAPAKYSKTEYNLVFIPKLVHPWYEDVKTGIDKAVAELKTQGITVNYTWDAPTDAVVTDQINKMESAASNNPDGISVAVIDPSAETSVINDLVSQGIKVSTFDCDAPDSKRLYYTGHSTNYQDGAQMADILAKSMNETGEVAVLSGTLSAANHQDRVKGFTDEMAKYPNIKIVDSQPDNDSIETAISLTESFLTAHPNLKGIFGCNAAAPIGAARAVTDAGKSGQVLIVGMAEDQEAMNFVKAGTILATLKQKVQEYGYNSVYNMLEIADGRQPAKVNDDLAADIVTKDNVDQFITK